jgi:hypothetical protein
MVEARLDITSGDRGIDVHDEYGAAVATKDVSCSAQLVLR